MKTVRAFSMSAGLETSTVTPGRTAPLASLTTPAISAFWAKALAGTINNAASKTRALALRRLVDPSTSKSVERKVSLSFCGDSITPVSMRSNS